jgi:hypothetical protein
MPKQPALPRLSHTMKKKVTRREAFLSEMDAVVPWVRLIGLIEPHYPKAGPKGGRRPMPLKTMLRVHFLQNWCALSDPMAEESLYDSEAMRHFAGIELGDDRVPGETTILNFRHLLERHELVAALPDVSDFRSGRDLSAWIGLTPKPHSTGGKERLGRISKMGNRYLRRLLYPGAVVPKARLRRDAQVSARRRGQAGEDWLWKIIERKKAKQAAIALANRMARTAYALMKNQTEFGAATAT